MGDLWLATAGDDIKLWDGNKGFSLLHTFNPHSNQNIAALAWNFEGSFLASCALESDHVVLTNTRSTVLPPIQLPCGAGVQCIDFSGESRFLMCGGVAGVCEWDLKTKSLKKSFKEHKGPVTTARYNCNRSYIASGSETGEIILHNTLTGQSCSPLRAPNVQAIRQLAYSAYKKSLLAAASDDGAVCLWDCNSRRLIHAFKGAHSGPATGLAFSPINEMLMMSVGLDKRFICYDIQQKQILKVFDTQSPLTCIDVMPDGATAAVGSTRGKVYIYDLRQGGSTPIHTFQAHKTSVHTVKFMPSSKSKMEESSGGVKAAMSTASMPRRQLPPAPTTVMQDVTPSKTGQIPDRGPQPGSPNPSVDVFSPTVAPTRALDEHSLNQSVSMSHGNLSAGTAPGQGSYSGVFSPMAEGWRLSAGSVPGAAYQDSSFFALYNNSLADNSGNVSKGKSLLHHHTGPQHHNLTGGGGEGGEHLSQNMAAGHLSHLGLSGVVHSPAVEDLSRPRMCSSLQNSTADAGRGEGGGGGRGLSVGQAGGASGVLSSSSECPGGQKVAGVTIEAMETGDGQNRSTESASPDSAAISGGEEGQIGGSRDSSSSSLPLPPTTTTTTNFFHPYHHHPATRVINGAASKAEAVEMGASGSDGVGLVQSELLRGLVVDAVEDVRDKLHKDIMDLRVAMIREIFILERKMEEKNTHYTDTIKEQQLYIRQLEDENKRLKKNY